MACSAHIVLLLFGYSTLVFQARSERSRNPCHPGRSSSALGTDCEFIRLPLELCRDCRLNGYDSRGILNRCDAIYNINAPKCKAGLQKYVRLNPCDTIRKKHVQNFKSRDSQFGLDYFTYSICEECCDCIPRGARANQYNSRLKRKGRQGLISLVRGNCPAHAYYDVCRVWPNVRDVVRPGQPFKKNRPKICPIIQRWFFSPNSKNWSSNDNTRMDGRIKEFLRILNAAAGCEKEAVWKMCIGLETAQNRVW